MPQCRGHFQLASTTPFLLADMALGGFDKTFIVLPPDELVCKLCDLVACQPQASHCQCVGLYCSSCVRQLKARCPDCQQRMQPTPDQDSRHRIAALPVKCDNADEGCEWIGDLGQLDTHLLSCHNQHIGCPYESVGCFVKVMRGEVAKHKELHVYKHLHLAMQRLERLEGKTETPPIVFQLRNFNYKKRHNETWYSPPFYTHIGGYKMCLQVDSNGDNIARNTHLSLYACLMRGCNDESLPWPFRGEVCLVLLNQRKDDGHKIETIHFRSREANEVNSRVEGREMSERGRGLPLFSPHSKLGLDEDNDTCYLLGDRLFFRVTSATAYDSNTPWLTTTHT